MADVCRLGGRVSSVRIALLSDDRLFCDGVARILQTDETFDVSVHESVESLDGGPGPRADVLLIDSRIDGALTLASSGRLATSFMLIAAPNDAAWCRDALCAGVSGVLPKNAGAGALISAVRAVAEGSVWAPRRVMADCIRHLVTTSVARSAGAATLDRRLSRREREIFRHAATGLGNKELAAQLSIGEATVKAHLTRIFQKLGVRGRAELAAVYHGAAPRSAASRLFVVPSPSPIVVRPRSNIASGMPGKK
jgi:two-component system nitrate/nitrite response regulator NarL